LNKDYLSYARDVGITTIAQVIVSGMQFARIPILTKGIDPTLYGIWSLIWTTIILATPLAILGLQTAFTRYNSGETDHVVIRDRFFSTFTTTLGTSLMLALTMLAICNYLPLTSSNYSLNLTFKLTAFMLCTQVLAEVTVNYFSTFRKMKIYSVLTSCRAVLTVILLCGTLAAGWALEGVISSFIISDGISIAAGLWLIVKENGFSFPTFKGLGAYLKFGIPLAGVTTLFWLLGSSDRYMIGYFMHPSDVGIYSAAYGIANILMLVINPLGIVLFPTISKLFAKGDLKSVQLYESYAFKYLLLLIVPAAFGLSILSRQLLEILTSPEFVSGWFIIPLVAFATLFYGLFQVAVYIIYLEGKTYIAVILLGAAAAVNITMNLLLVPAAGILGAGIATLISYLLLCLATTIYANRLIKLTIGASPVLKCTAASVIMAAVLWFINPSGIVPVALSIMAGTAVYFIIIYVIKFFSIEEAKFLRGLLPGGKK